MDIRPKVLAFGIDLGKKESRSQYFYV